MPRVVDSAEWLHERRVLRRARVLVSAALVVSSCSLDERNPSVTSDPPARGGDGAPSARVGALSPSSGECPGCSVDGECVASGTRGPNPCDICDPVRERSGWSFNEGASCDDGLFCTVDEVCLEGACSGSPRLCDDGVACNGVSTCDEVAGACSPSVNLCAAGALCGRDGACVTECTGCVIDGTCVPSGAERPDNPCRVCDPTQSRTGYVGAVGKACGSGPEECSDQDTCDAGGACNPNHRLEGTVCGESNGCKLDDTCQRGICAPGAPLVCPPGLVCDPSTVLCLCEDGQFRCTGNQLEFCSGGVFTIQETCAGNGLCDAAAQRCGCADDTDPNTTVVDDPRFGCGFDRRVGGDRWVTFSSSSLELDPINGYAWSLQDFVPAEQLPSVCAALNIGGITGWRLPTIDEARTVAAGCPSLDACPLTDPTCLSSDCSRCARCVENLGPAGAPYSYCRTDGLICQQMRTSSPCTDCGPGFTWMYSGLRGNFGVNDVADSAVSYCFHSGISL